jgi:rubredoxin
MNTIPNKLPEVGCTDGCGATGVNDESCVSPNAVQVRGWQFLEISKRWRCPDCRAALDKANKERTDGSGS